MSWQGPTLDFPSDAIVPPGGVVELSATADRPLRLLRLLAPDEVARAWIDVEEVQIGNRHILATPRVPLVTLRDAATFWEYPTSVLTGMRVRVKVSSKEKERSIRLSKIRFAVAYPP